MEFKLGIYVICLILLSSYWKIMGEKKLVKLTCISFFIVMLIVILQSEFTHIELLHYTYNNSVLKMLESIIILLSTAHIFILGFESKKIFNRSLSEYYSSHFKSIYSIYGPVLIYILLIIVLKEQWLYLITLHMLIYEFLLFVDILDEVFKWNKRKIKNCYTNQVKEQFLEFPVNSDSVSVANFLADMANYKVLENEIFNKEQLLNNRILKIKREKSDRKSFFKSKDEIAIQIFKSLIIDYIENDRTSEILCDEPYYVLSMLKYLTTEELYLLFDKPNFNIQEIENIMVFEEIFNVYISNKCKKENNTFYWVNKLKTIIEKRISDNKQQLEFLIKLYIALYSNGIKIYEEVNSCINNEGELAQFIIIEAIIDWHNYILEKPIGKYEKREELSHNQKINIDKYIQIKYLDKIKNEEEQYEEIEKIIIQSKSIYGIVHNTLEMKYISGVWSSTTIYEEIVQTNLLKILHNKLMRWDKKTSNAVTIEEALELDKIAKLIGEIAKNHNAKHHVINRFNQIILIKHEMLKEYYDEMPNIIGKLDVINDILGKETRDKINKYMDSLEKDIFISSENTCPKVVSENIEKLFKILQVDEIKNDDIVQINSESTGREIYYKKVEIYKYIISEYEHIQLSEMKDEIEAFLKKESVFFYALGIMMVHRYDQVYTIGESYNIDSNKNYYDGLQEALHYKVKHNQNLDKRQKEMIEKFKVLNMLEIGFDMFNIINIYNNLKIWPIVSNGNINQFEELFINSYDLEQLFEKKYNDYITGETAIDSKHRIIYDILSMEINSHYFVSIKFLNQVYGLLHDYIGEEHTIRLLKAIIDTINREGEKYQYKDLLDKESHENLINKLEENNKLLYEYMNQKINPY